MGYESNKHSPRVAWIEDGSVWECVADVPSFSPSKSDVYHLTL